MAQTASKRGKDETKAAEKKGKATDKPVGSPRGGITAPVTPSLQLAEIVGKKQASMFEINRHLGAHLTAKKA